MGPEKVPENGKAIGLDMHNISIHLTLLELAIGRESSWFGVIELRDEIGIVAQVISVVIFPLLRFGQLSPRA